MGIVINTNIPSISAARSLYTTRSDLEQAMERLSSGKRINGAKDDAAGMSVVSKMKAQITSLNQAVRNANDGISLISTYDGAADEIQDILIRMRELATLAATGTYTSDDISNANLEYAQLVSEINRIQEQTKFNGTIEVASASTTGITASFHVGFGPTNQVGVTLESLHASALMVKGGGSNYVGTITTATAGASAIVAVDNALKNLNVGRATAGAMINRLEHTVANLMNVVQRTEEARSRIEDADFAKESAALARANVLVQAGSAMLAQANQSPQYVLALLRG
ncbi:MAG: flagellin FliC [Actinobacteria bacterium]|jgi:flagellin|nr:flagellin FliC [Actinomycetota bacterium]